jgi:uncharacterized protein
MRFALTFMALYAVVFAADLLLLRLLQPSWWQRRWLRRLLYGQFPFALLGSALWLISREYGFNSLLAVGWGLLAVLFLYLGSLLIALLLSALPLLAAKLWTHIDPPPTPARRAFLGRALATLPIAGAGGVSYGLVRSASGANLREVPLYFADLPASLEGLRILHISDIHIGPYIRLPDLEKLLLRAEELQPDLALITGDICDHMPDFLDTLRLLEALPTRLGSYCSLGNHEYIRGVRRVRRLFSQTTLPLLVDSGQLIDVGGTPLYVAAADDPRYLRSAESYTRLRSSVEKAVDGAPQEAFSILLSHRSQALDYASPLGIDLTLSGHTHGFQLGLGGRSLFDSLLPDRYIWGHYQQGQSQLYTSCGVGHWLPFRFGFPPEAPLIVLHRA